MLSSFSVFLEATGSFSKRGMASVISVVLNVGLSILFLKVTNLQIFGVVLATIIARLISVVPIYINIVAKDIFEKKQKTFWVYYIGSLVVVCVSAVCAGYLVSFIHLQGIVGFIVKAIVCVALVGGVWILCLSRTKEFQYIRNIVLGFAKGRGGRK